MAVVSPSTSLTLEVRYPSRPGMLAQITAAIGAVEGLIRDVHIVVTENGSTTRSIEVEAWDEDHQQRIADAVAAVPEVDLLNWQDRTFALHRGGKIAVVNKQPIKDRDALSRAYTPGVARVCTRVKNDMAAVYRYTIKANTVAVVSDGSAVLGLGNIGPYGALPVMEGKAMLFKEFANIDAFPLCLNTQDVDEIVATVKAVAPVFGGINLEDISAPRCFVVEERLQAELDIPVFHDDQHGTAVVVAAGLTNALRVTGRELAQTKVVISGAGAAGMAVAKLLMSFGVGDLILCDTKGAIHAGRTAGMNSYKTAIAQQTNRDNCTGSLEDALRGADVFIGVSGPNVLAVEALRAMAPSPIVFALANPTPEVDPQGAMEIAGVLATGRSDFPNQVNNAVAFPGIFRGLLDSRVPHVTQPMLIAAAKALAATVAEKALCPELIIPSVFQEGVCEQVAGAVRRVAAGAS
ncbi:MAG: NAD-dependent malic enzyme [Armatimonadetes bacterium]|nr:NAD-dependent malic enzyme [Armatimonadota bacterium]